MLWWLLQYFLLSTNRQQEDKNALVKAVLHRFFLFFFLMQKQTNSTYVTDFNQFRLPSPHRSALTEPVLFAHPQRLFEPLNTDATSLNSSVIVVGSFNPRGSRDEFYVDGKSCNCQHSDSPHLLFPSFSSRPSQSEAISGSGESSSLPSSGRSEAARLFTWFAKSSFRSDPRQNDQIAGPPNELFLEDSPRSSWDCG